MGKTMGFFIVKDDDCRHFVEIVMPDRIDRFVCTHKRVADYVEKAMCQALDIVKDALLETSKWEAD